VRGFPRLVYDPPPMAKFYISTAIHYVNDLPHIGHIYENVVADVIARYRRMKGDDVFFLTGTDEHGQKIERSAAKEGVRPIELADRVVANHHENWKKLSISHDDFIRTTEQRHKAGVYELIRRIQQNNPDDLYEGEHTGWYCSSEETFVPESQVTDGKCESGHPVEKTTEKNIFFRLSKYQQPLLDHYKSNPDFVMPKTRLNEVVSFVAEGLKDLSVSRSSIQWGIPFPGHEGHVIYVWMDALTNYISALGFGSDDSSRFDKYWPADIHLIGKDIVRFHAVYWPAFLMAAGLPLPKQIVGHGWWLRDNQKISKSTGNVVRPDAIIDQFGPDAFRYFLLREMVFGQDANYSDEAFITRYNADLANDLGNTLSRALKMSHAYYDGKTPPIDCAVNVLRDAFDRILPQYIEAMESLQFQRALDAVWKYIVETNSYIVTREPWRRFKEKGKSGALSRILWIILEAQRLTWLMLLPFMPALAEEALRRLGAADAPRDRKGYRWGYLPTDEPIESGDGLFPRIDAQEFLGNAANNSAKDAKMTDTNPPADPAAAKKEAGAPLETTQAMPPDAVKISIDKFFETDLRVAEVLEAERVEKSKKLLKLKIDLGDEQRTLVAGIATKYAPEELIGRKIVVVANLQPAKLMGIESNGMVLAASIDGEPSLLSVDSAVPVGTKVK
jgi:methionyl-tRNA synthetase